VNHFVSSISRIGRAMLGLAAIFAFESGLAPAQSTSALSPESLTSKILSVTPNREAGAPAVAVLVKIQAVNQAIVVPNCEHDGSKSELFCVAALQYASGKTVRVRRHLEASLGVESPDTWSPVTIAPGTSASFLFYFDTEMLDVSPGQKLRVDFEVWPTMQSVKDLKKGTNFQTPIFACPSR
jgi:hypothetical protein